HAGGAFVQWARPRGAHALLAGLEAREVGGSSEEEIVSGAGLTRVVAEGRQRSAAAYLQDVWAVSPRWVVTAGARADLWRNRDRSESALSPRLAARYQARRALALSGSAYGAFRAPTLNELYRSFRVGNVLTEADPSLRAERLRGVEAAALLAPASALSARLTAFWMEVDDTVANVTLSSTPALVTRQRRNLGRIRSRGGELEVETRPAAAWVLSGSWTVADATVRAFPEAPALEGLRLAQVPRHQVAVQGRYDGRRVRVSAQARWSSRQFEDDLNALELGPARNLDLRAAWRPAPRLEAYLALENALDSEQEVGRTPVVTLAPPRTLRAGLRLHMGRDPGTAVAHR
ncbi:MAG TPA: TonB-dependent receptor, partial [Vicinamibacteria bacterium]|nr:TonB-dependent receptor [Vicinamibacteria bacterium]